MKATIYQIVCPINNVPIYVGCTTRSLEERLAEHMSFCASSRLTTYLKKLKAIPLIQPLEVISFRKHSVMLKREAWWINKISKQYKILNRNGKVKKKYKPVYSDIDVHTRVKIFIIGKEININEFYDAAVLEKLRSPKK